MSQLLCPRCRELYVGTFDGSQWLSCRRCQHRWLPSPSSASTVPAAIPVAPPAAIPVDPPAAIQVAAPATAVPPVGEPRAAGASRIFDSDEYAPAETADMRRRTKALTNRHDGQPAFSPGRLPAQPPAATPVSSASSPLPVVKAASRASTDPFDPDLFERAAREAQVDRAKLHTVAEGAPPSAAAQPHPVTCPVCGHGFLSNKPEQDQQICPQCHTSFNLAKGHVVAGGVRGSGGDPLIGRVLRGCLIDRKVGEGGMGTVYHAKQLSLDRSVAVKVLPPELARNKNFIQRFEREAKSLAKINHPNILHIYDFGEDPPLGIYYMIIEFVEGHDLGEMLHESYTLGQVEVLDILRQASMGLEMAAEKGVIHRDIKPDNLMLTKDGICKVSDFGLAKGQSAEKDVTSIGVRVGTPAFMSPEQCDGDDVDFRSDIYNLGCTAFLALTGQLPYDADTPFAIMLKHKNDPVPSPLKYNPNLDPRVESLVMRMIAKKPQDRFSNLRELIDRVEELEVALAGTSAVLRKSRGPFRAMSEKDAVAHARMTSQGLREISPRPGPPPPALPVAPPPARAVTTPAPVGPSGVPDWLKPVEPVTTSRKSSSTHASASAPPNPAPAAAQSGFRDLRAKLTEARNRNLQDEAESLSEEANRLSASGQHEAAAAVWTRAATINPNARASQQLFFQATQARRRGGRRRVLRIMVWMLVLVGAIAAGGFWGVPVAHQSLAERELMPIEGIASHVARQRELERFITRHLAPIEWYRRVFQRGYELPAIIQARRLAEEAQRAASAPPPTPTAVKAPVPRFIEELAQLERMRSDPATAWSQVAGAARVLAAKAQGEDLRQAKAVLAEAEVQVLAMVTDIEALKELWNAGRQGEVVTAAAAFRGRYPRAGELTPAALPGRLVVIDADDGHELAGVQASTQAQVPASGAAGVFVGGGRLVAGDTQFCRYPHVAVMIEVMVPGYRSERVQVPADTDAKELTVSVKMHPGVVWQRQLDGAPRWLRMQPFDEHMLLVRTPETIALVRHADGDPVSALSRDGVQVQPVPSATAPRWTDCFELAGEQSLAATTDGLAVVLAIGGAPARVVAGSVLHRGQAPVLAYREKELTFQAGRRASFVIEATPQGMRLSARTPEKDLWTVAGLKGFKEPWMAFRDAVLLVMDDHRVTAVDELDGHQVASVALSSPRTSAPVFFAQGSLMVVATAGGTNAVRLPAAGTANLAILSDEVLTQAGGSVIAGLGDDLLIARPDRGVQMLTWSGDHFVRTWANALPADAGAVIAMGLGSDHILIADDAGAIYLLARTNGTLLRRIAHGEAALCAPFIHAGLLVVGDRGGRITAYRLPPLKLK